MHMRKVADEAEKREYWHLLLDADPSRQMVERYLRQGEMYVMEEEGRVVAEAVVLPLTNDVCELKNLAVLPSFQGRGLGLQMVQRLCGCYERRFSQMLVGTSRKGQAFYEACGFTFFRVKKGFFLQYPEPVVEDGMICEDMYLLKRNLKKGDQI